MRYSDLYFGSEFARYDCDDYETEGDFYDEDEIETLLEDDEISSGEEGFMRGYMGD